MKLKELCQDILTKQELELLPSAFDTVGDIIIFNDFPKELKEKEKKIGQRIIEHYAPIQVVAKKTGKYAGKFRTPLIRIMAGKRRKSTLLKENGVQLMLHVEKVYFSARTATERARIIAQVKPTEKVLIMFSGIGPLAIEIAKHKKAQVTGVEVNPDAHVFAQENAKLNKVQVDFYSGDVRTILPKLGTFDRIAMPLPKDAAAFFELALTKANKGAIIHLYAFDNLENIPVWEEKIKVMAKAAQKKVKILDAVKCGQFSPREFRLCFDVKVL